MMEKGRGFDANSLLREYAQKVMRHELPLPAVESDIRVVPLGDEYVVTAADFLKICEANTEEFRNSKDAN